MYEIKFSKRFLKDIENLQFDFNLSKQEIRMAKNEIFDAVDMLAENGTLPAEYFDHELKERPWVGFNEFHVFCDLLVIYFRIDAKQRIRMVRIRNHSNLRQGEE